ncbi:MAG: ABC transporter permease [Oscillospiraceae bacterium]|nr:ABC transporter permease [Oscillospiraceae bacterium]
MLVKGWDKVFKFTYIQLLKSKTYIISTVVILVVMFLIAACMNFLPGLLSDTADSQDSASSTVFGGIEKVIINDQSGISPAPDFSFLGELGVDVVMISDGEVEANVNRLSQSSEPEILVELTKEIWGFSLLASRPESITGDDCRAVLGVLNHYVWNSHLVSLGVPADRVDEAWGHVSTQVTVAGEAPHNEIASLMASLLPMLSSIILIIFILSYAQFTGQSIAMEKTSRVMETLLTSVRPMAVILGKSLGVGLASFTQFLILGLGSALVAVVVAPFGILGEVFGMIEVSSESVELIKVAFDEVLVNFNPLAIIWIVLIFILGFFFYSLIAGLFGASVSRIEDLQSAMLPLNLIGIFGFYLAYISPAFSVASEGVNVMERLSYYLPISSPFALPGAILSGTMGTFETLLSVLVLAVCGVLMLMFVARVYEAIILHTGNRIKLGAMLKLAKKK